MKLSQTRFFMIVLTVMFALPPPEGRTAGTEVEQKKEFARISGLTSLAKEDLESVSVVASLEETNGVVMAAGRLSKKGIDTLLADRFFDFWEHGLVPDDLAKQTFGLIDLEEYRIPEAMVPDWTRQFYRIAILASNRRRIYLIDPLAKNGQNNFFFVFVRF